MPLPTAVLWDLDGTMVDSEPYWVAAEHKLAQMYKVNWTVQDELSVVGAALTDTGAALKAKGIDLSVAEIVDFMVNSVVTDIGAEVPWQLGVLDLLAALKAVEVPCALVTMSYQVIADQIIAGTAPGTFQVVISGDNVTHGKPHPEPYLLAAERLGVDITRSVAIEDSFTGVASARSAGARVLAVQRKLQIPAAEALSRVGDLASLTVEDLSRIAAGHVIDRLTLQEE